MATEWLVLGVLLAVGIYFLSLKIDRLWQTQRAIQEQLENINGSTHMLPTPVELFEDGEIAKLTGFLRGWIQVKVKSNQIEFTYPTDNRSFQTDVTSRDEFDRETWENYRQFWLSVKQLGGKNVGLSLGFVRDGVLLATITEYGLEFK